MLCVRYQKHLQDGDTGGQVKVNLGRGVTERLTDDHNGELNTLPDFVSPPLSGCERHFCFFALLVVVRRGIERVVGVSLSWSTAF